MKKAVIETKGSQLQVKEGDIITIDRLKQKPGEKVEFNNVVLVQDDEKLITDDKALKKIKVQGEVVGELRGEKIRVSKYKAKKNYRRTIGHRSDFTKVKINEIAIGK
ncbi:MAG: 50S ribosomal protein L21 [bacterium]